MRRNRRRRAARIGAVVYVSAMAAGGLVVGAHGPTPVDSLLSGLSQPGLNILYAFILLPLAAVFDGGGGAGDAGHALACGLGAAVNVLLLRTVVCFALAVRADLPARRKRRTPVR
ncbi:hypothetical protein ACFYSH_12645 [Streptomyces sp. NPDC005791]|uniref:hypothetical protein n=1 Tax=unclassified Streptomyces TaxID=2593676 RepID=UPI0033C1A602